MGYRRGPSGLLASENGHPRLGRHYFFELVVGKVTERSHGGSHRARWVGLPKPSLRKSNTPPPPPPPPPPPWLIPLSPLPNFLIVFIRPRLVPNAHLQLAGGSCSKSFNSFAIRFWAILLRLVWGTTRKIGQAQSRANRLAA
jgi:hypothetical protein